MEMSFRFKTLDFSVLITGKHKCVIEKAEQIQFAGLEIMIEWE